MKLHELKIKKQYLSDIYNNGKSFELRKNDRDYQVGDLFQFIVVDDNGNINEELTRRYKRDTFKIMYVLKDVEHYGLDKEYCIFSFKKINVLD